MFVIIVHNRRVGAAAGGRVKVAIYQGICGGAREGCVRVVPDTISHELFAGAAYEGGGGETTVPVCTTHIHARAYIHYTHARAKPLCSIAAYGHTPKPPLRPHIYNVICTVVL